MSLREAPRRAHKWTINQRREVEVGFLLEPASSSKEAGRRFNELQRLYAGPLADENERRIAAGFELHLFRELNAQAQLCRGIIPDELLERIEAEFQRRQPPQADPIPKAGHQ